LLRFAAANLRWVFEREGRVDHSEIAAIARAALIELESPTELAMRRAAALKHLLVDEFQDTSSEQSQLLETLLVGWAPDDGRSLFVVGDPMQSIYQFRSAEVGLFLRAREQGIGDVPLENLQLTLNFRSLEPLIAWCNSAFVDIFPPDDDVRESAVSFLPALWGESRRADPPGKVHVHPLPTPEPSEEAARLADALVEARRRRPDCSAAVLVQSSSHAPPIIEALRQRGIAARGVDLEPLARQPAVRDVVELGCALLHPADRVAWLAVLRAPACGLDLADLLALTTGADADAPIAELLADESRLRSLSIDGQQRIARCAAPLLQALAERGRVDFVAQLQRTWETLGGPAALATSAEWQHVLAYLAELRDRAREAPLLDGTLLRSLAESLRLGGDPTPGGVEVLTIHKAKGLEWDVVFLPGLSRRLRSDDRPLLSWIELPRPDRDADLLMAALSVGRGRSDDRLGAYIAQLRKQRQRHERTRLAYVAATRAREELHLFGHAAPDREGDLRPPPNSMLQTFWPAVSGEFEAAGSSPAPEEVGAPARIETLSTILRLPADWQAPPIEAPPETTSLRVDGLEDKVLKPEYEWASVRRRAVGTVVHGELESLGLGAKNSMSARESGWRTRLTELGVSTEEIVAAVDEVRILLQGVADDAQLQWILSDAHEDAASEFRLSGFIGGQLRDVVIDRTFVDAGTRWVIDYKTGTHEGADLDEFLSSELERYRPQLETYRSLARGLGAQPVRAALYFPALKRLVELR
ncbi:MAG: 3'-5' exonuclease, partial [Steroidobacteraceae bacterium]